MKKISLVTISLIIVILFSFSFVSAEMDENKGKKPSVETMEQGNMMQNNMMKKMFKKGMMEGMSQGMSEMMICKDHDKCFSEHKIGMILMYSDEIALTDEQNNKLKTITKTHNKNMMKNMMMNK
ncbi:MAG: hypothetical protein HY934_10470 [Candidatus Firestonebacteria bacterium]|nr:hypothetical protein [Candidatus Firestonebacteria bacterium]